MPIAKRYNFTSNAALSSSNLNTNFDDIINAFNAHTHTGTGTDAPLITTSGIGNGTGFGVGDVWNVTTPSVTNMTVGNGSSVMYYTQVGKTVTARYRFLLGTTSAIATNPNISLPVQAAATYLGNDVIGDGIAFTGGQWKLSPVFVNVNTFRPMLWQAGGTYVSGITTFTAAIPSGGWVATDSFVVNLRYQAA